MQQYLLSIYQPDGEPPPPEILDPIIAEMAVLADEIKAAGAWVFNGGLHPPSTATVVALQDGDLLITDGPYLEGKEHIGGFTGHPGGRPGRRTRVGPQAGSGAHYPDRGPADG